MEEIIQEKLNGDEIRVRKVDWTYFRKADLEAMKIRMEAELQKVNNLLAGLSK